MHSAVRAVLPCLENIRSLARLHCSTFYTEVAQEEAPVSPGFNALSYLKEHSF